MLDKKFCPTCLEYKKYDEFAKNNSKSYGDGYTATCKACRRLHSKKYYENNKADHIKKVMEARKRRKEDKPETKNYSKNIPALTLKTGTRIVNALPYPITLEYNDGEQIILESSGYLLAEIYQVEGEYKGSKLIKKAYQPTPEGLKFLKRCPKNALIIASPLACRAYAGLLVSPIPLPGQELVALEKKIMSAERFETYEKDWSIND